MALASCYVVGAELNWRPADLECGRMLRDLQPGILFGSGGYSGICYRFVIGTRHFRAVERVAGMLAICVLTPCNPLTVASQL